MALSHLVVTRQIGKARHVTGVFVHALYVGSMMSSETCFTFNSQRMTLSAVKGGQPDHPALILVHGGRDQKRSWDQLAAHLISRFHVIRYDLRGHGESDWVSDGEYAVMDHVFDLASLIDHLQIRQVTLIGHSLGGNIALRYGGLFPGKIERLVAIEGLGPSPKMLAERLAEPAHERLQNWIEQRRSMSQRQPRRMISTDEAHKRMRAAFPHLPVELTMHLTRTGLRQNQDGTMSWAYDPAGMGRSPSDIPHDALVDLWQRISCPVWLVYGADSWASNPAEDGRAANFSCAEVTEFKAAGHWVHHDQFDNFRMHLDQFLGHTDHTG